MHYTGIVVQVRIQTPFSVHIEDYEGIKKNIFIVECLTKLWYLAVSLIEKIENFS